MPKAAKNTEAITVLDLLIKIAKNDEGLPEYFIILMEYLKLKYETSVYDI